MTEAAAQRSRSLAEGSGRGLPEVLGVHLGDPREREVGSVADRLDWYFETATVVFEMAVAARMRELGCDKATAILDLDRAWRKLDERRFGRPAS